MHSEEQRRWPYPDIDCMTFAVHRAPEPQNPLLVTANRTAVRQKHQFTFMGKDRHVFFDANFGSIPHFIEVYCKHRSDCPSVQCSTIEAQDKAIPRFKLSFGGRKKRGKSWACELFFFEYRRNNGWRMFGRRIDMGNFGETLFASTPFYMLWSLPALSQELLALLLLPKMLETANRFRLSPELSWYPAAGRIATTRRLNPNSRMQPVFTRHFSARNIALFLGKPAHTSQGLTTKMRKHGNAVSDDQAKRLWKYQGR
ncbi:hypothetical protein C8J56DRAFT_1170719 [Mycena floridula]|nr:hypothetical protein C8J56DRAFT_1170719 [Mycena floridula]